VLNGVDFAENTSQMTAEERRKVYRSIGKAQMDAWSKGSGFFYWNYKMLLDTVNDPNWFGWDCWDLGKSVDEGWFPGCF
jgi:hypothetical protein